MSIYSVSLSPGSENVNTFGGEVIFPQDWQLTRIISSYESVRYWIRSPQVTDPGTIAYSGLFPGGLTEALGEGHDQGQVGWPCRRSPGAGTGPSFRVGRDSPMAELHAAHP